MPGIIGIISKTSPDKRKQDLDKMITCMKHEKSYSSGSYINDKLGIYTGWLCHKDSFCDCLPIWNEKKNIVLIFIGENFTDHDLFNTLKAKNHVFDNYNASSIIHMYEEYGINFLQKLNGWFCGLLIDLQKDELIIFNDRYGMQHIYYHENKDAYLFASEAKALLMVCPELRALDMQGLGEFLTCGGTLEDRTLYKNIFLLPCASAWIYQRNNLVKKEIYFTSDEWENQTLLEKDFFYDKLKETFVRILPRYFRANQQIGLSLTGGVDTRMLLANIDLSSGKYPCYTFGGMYRDCYDVKFAREIASAVNQTHQVINLDRNFLNNFSEYAEKTVYISDGYIDVSGSAELYANKLARNIAPIRMTGDFGGEILRNLGWKMNNYLAGEHFSGDLRNLQDDIAEAVAKTKQKTDNPLSFELYITMPKRQAYILSIAQSQLTIRTPYVDNDLIALMYRAPMVVQGDKEFSLRLIADGNPALSKIPTDRGICVNFKFPFSTLIPIYYEFLAKAEYAYNYGMPQWLARFDYTFKFMHFERLFLGRHKFYHLRLWYRDELADYVKAVLLDDRTLNRPYLNRKTIEKMVESHTRGYRNYTTEITQLLSMELIQRLLIEN